MKFTYAVFGLLLESNLPIPELTPIRPNHDPSSLESSNDRVVAIHLNASPPTSGGVPAGPEELSFATSYKDPAGNPALRIWKAAGSRYLRLAYYDGTQFWLDREGREVWATWPGNLALEDTATYLLGPVLGILLRLRGVTCLHASAVAFGERAVAFVGSEGAGKSTTAAALARRGHAVLSDDVVALAERDGSFVVHPAYPYLCLWPESVESLYGSAEALPQFSANYEKRCLSLGKQELRFAEQALPLAAIYILGERRETPLQWSKSSRRSGRSWRWWPIRLRRIPWTAACALKNLKFWRAWPPAFPSARFLRIKTQPAAGGLRSAREGSARFTYVEFRARVVRKLIDRRLCTLPGQ